MPVDASIPLSLKEYKPYDPIEGTARAYSLKSMIDQDKERQNALEERQKLKDIFGKADLSSPEGQQQTLKDVGAVSPEQRMNLQKSLSDQAFKSSEIEKNKSTAEMNAQHKQLLQMQEHEKFLDHAASVAGSANDAYDDAVANKQNSAVAQAKASAVHTEGAITAYQNGLISEEMLKKMLSKPWTREESGAFAQSVIPMKEQLANKRKQFEDQLKERQAASSDKRADASLTMASAAMKRADIAEKKGAAGSEAGLSDDALNLASDMLLRGDTSVLTNLGRGAQGAKNVTAIRNRAAEKAKERGLNAGDLVANNVQLKGEAAGSRTAGTRGANLGIAAVELDKFSGIALDASDKVPRTQFVPLNKAVMAVQKGAGSPEVAAFVAANESVINSFAQVAGRGTPTVAGQEHARHMLNTAQTPEQYKAVVKQLKAEAKAASESTSEVQKSQRERLGAHKPAGDVVHWDDLK